MSQGESNGGTQIERGRPLTLRFFLLVRQYWNQLGAGLAVSALLIPITMIGPFISQYLIDGVYPSRDVGLLQAMMAIYFASLVFGAFVRAVQSYYASLLQTKLTASLRLHFFNHIQHQRQVFFDSRRVGEIHSRFGDLQIAAAFLSRLISASSIGFLYLIAVPPVLLYVNWRLASIAMIAIPLSMAMNFAVAGRLRHSSKIATESAAESASFIVEFFTHVRTFKSLAQEAAQLRKYSGYVQRTSELQLRAVALTFAMGLLTALVDAVGFAAFTYFSWLEILSGTFSIGALFAFSALLGYVRGPAAQLVSLYSDSQDFSVRLQRVFEYLDESGEADPKSVFRHSQHSIVASPSVQLCDVRFTYSDGGDIFRRLNLELYQGTTTAVVGRSGCGKTSLLRLICRLENPNSGRILVDGSDIAALDVRVLRRRITAVWQDPVLIRGSLLDNITLGAEGVSKTLIDSAIGACQLEELLSSLPRGLESPLSEWGSNISGGQRQRIALARAVVRQSGLVLLDEVSSQIDLVTEKRIFDEIFTLLKGKTIIFVTHRMSTAKLADRICVFDRGGVVSAGDHSSLIGRCAVYQALYGHDAIASDRNGTGNGVRANDRR